MMSRKKDNSTDKDLNRAMEFFLFGLVFGILLGYLIIAYLDPVGSPVAAIILLPIIFFIVSMAHCFMAMKGGHNLELILIVLLDLFLSLVLFGIMLASL